MFYRLPFQWSVLGIKMGLVILHFRGCLKRMKEQPIKQEVTDLGHRKSVFYRFKDLKINVDYIIPVVYRQPTSDSTVACFVTLAFVKLAVWKTVHCT